MATKASDKSSNKESDKTSTKTPTKASAKSSDKASTKTSAKSSTKTPTKSSNKESDKTPTKASAKSSDQESNNQVVFAHEDGWGVRKEGSDTTTVVYDTRVEALNRAREIAENQGGEVYILYTGEEAFE